MPFRDLKSIATDIVGVTKLLPIQYEIGDDEFVEVRLNMGLYVEINVQNTDVVINFRTVAAMRGSENPEVVKFVKKYNDTLGLV